MRSSSQQTQTRRCWSPSPNPRCSANNSQPASLATTKSNATSLVTLHIVYDNHLAQARSDVWLLCPNISIRDITRLAFHLLTMHSKMKQTRTLSFGRMQKQNSKFEFCTMPTRLFPYNDAVIKVLVGFKRVQMSWNFTRGRCRHGESRSIVCIRLTKYQ